MGVTECIRTQCTPAAFGHNVFDILIAGSIDGSLGQPMESKKYNLDSCTWCGSSKCSLARRTHPSLIPKQLAHERWGLQRCLVWCCGVPNYQVMPC